MTNTSGYDSPYVHEVTVTDGNIITRHYFSDREAAEDFGDQYTNIHHWLIPTPVGADAVATLLNKIMSEHTRHLREVENAAHEIENRRMG